MIAHAACYHGEAEAVSIGTEGPRLTLARFIPFR